MIGPRATVIHMGGRGKRDGHCMRDWGGVQNPPSPSPSPSERESTDTVQKG